MSSDNGKDNTARKIAKRNPPLQRYMMWDEPVQEHTTPDRYDLSSFTIANDNRAPHHYIHMVVDVQKRFAACADGCRGTAHTEEVSARIAALMADLRGYDVPQLIIYNDKHGDGIMHAEGGLHHIAAEDNDTLYAKQTNSAFASGNGLAALLHAMGNPQILVSGFNLSVCIQETLADAFALSQDFTFHLLDDCVSNDLLGGKPHVAGHTRNFLRNNGVNFTDSHAVRHAFARIAGGGDNGENTTAASSQNTAPNAQQDGSQNGQQDGPNPALLQKPALP